MEGMRHGRGDYNQEGMYKPKVGEDWGGSDDSYAGNSYRSSSS
jgi:hypothetical protein